MSDDILELPSNNDKSKNNRENGLMHLFAILDTMKIKYDFPPNGKSNFINNRIGIYGDYELNISINDYTVDMKQLCSHLNKELMKYGCHVSRDNYNTMTLKYDSSLLVKEQEFKSYNTIVFDIGGVLIEREKLNYKVIERNLGIIDDIEFRELMMLYYGIANEHDNLKYSEIVELYKAVLPDRFKNKAEKLIDVALAKKVCKYTYHLLQQLKEKGYKLYYLSNATRHRHEIYKKKGLLDFLKYFDGGLLSYLEGVEKPDPEFYKRLINKYKLNPSNCLFIDDNENNINTARQLKFNTLHYNNPNKINLYSIIESVIFETAWKSKVDIDQSITNYNEAKRSELPDSSFGIPEDRKYPLDTEQHVKSAIKLFGHAEESKKKYLAKRINTAAKKYDISIPETTQCYKYLSEGGFYDMIPEDITTIVFDMGNVLVGSDIEGTIHRALTINHTLIHQISDILIDDIISCEPKDKGIKNGTVKYAKNYFNSIVPEIVLQYTDLIFNLLNDALFKYSYVDELIASFKTKGYMVYYLSNWMGWTYELQKEFFGPLISKFDGGLFSFETNYEKPQEEFYRLFFEKFHLDPEKCFFFDDKSENISAAERVGMRGMIFNHEETPKQLLAGNFDIPSNANNKILVSTGVNIETMNIKSIKKWYCCNNPKPCSIDENLFCKTLESAIKLYVQEYELDNDSIEKYVFTTNGTIHENGGLTMIPLGRININPDYTYEWNIQYPLIKEENGILSSGLTEWSMAACNPIKGISKPFLVKIVPDYNSTINPAMYAFSPDIVSDKYLVINENAELEIVDSNKFKDCTIESYEFIGDNKEYLVNKIYKAYQEHKIVDNTFFYTTLTGKPMLCEDQIEYDKSFHKVDYDLMVENIITELVTFKENVIKCIYNTNTTLPVLESVANIAPSLKGYKNISVKTDIDGYYYNNTLTKKRSRSVENISELSEAMLMSTL